jgi:hypothetical protein
VGYCYPSVHEKTLCKWDIYVCPTGHERVKQSQREWCSGIALQSSRQEDPLGLVQCHILRYINMGIKPLSFLTSACHKHEAGMSVLKDHADKKEI